MDMGMPMFNLSMVGEILYQKMGVTDNYIFSSQE